MASTEPSYQRPRKTTAESVVDIVRIVVREVLGSWHKVMQAVILLSAPIIAAAIVVLYIKADAKLWAGVGALGAFCLTVARSLSWWRNRALRNAELPHENIPPSEGPPSPTSTQGDAGPGSKRERDNDVSQ
jgi:hypothetical protein